MNTNTERVGAESVAKFLGVTKTTVYSLAKGVRGWKRIEPLPYHVRASNPVRDRLEFDLNEISAWQARVGFRVSEHRNRHTPRVQLQEATA